MRILHATQMIGDMAVKMLKKKKTLYWNSGIYSSNLNSASQNENF